MRLKKPTEADFLAQVIQLAKLYGWRTFHARPARTASGWRTPVQGDGAGFVDLVLVRPGEPPIFAELKTDAGRVTQPQQAWLEALAATGARVFVWRPCVWGQIEAILTAPRRGP